MNRVEITHTSSAGTCLNGVPKSDLEARIYLRGCGWSPIVGDGHGWRQRQSQGQAANLAIIAETQRRLEKLAGYEVAVTISSDG